MRDAEDLDDDVPSMETLMVVGFDCSEPGGSMVDSGLLAKKSVAARPDQTGPKQRDN